MFGANNQLWDILLDPTNGYLSSDGEITADSLIRFVQDQAADENNLKLLKADGTYAATKGVAVYTGTTNGIYNGNIANDLSIRSGDKITVLDRTRLAGR